MKSWLSSCYCVLALVHFIKFDHVVLPTHLKPNRVHTCVCCCKRGTCSTHYSFGRWEPFFMATSCGQKDFLWLQDIVSSESEFYCWKEASREQRVGLIIPVFAVWASEGDHLSRVHSQRRDLLNHVERSVPVTWETDDTNINTHTHIKASVPLCAETHVETLARIHNQKHARIWTVPPHSGRVTRVICLLVLFALQIQQNVNVNTWLNLLEQHDLIS